MIFFKLKKVVSNQIYRLNFENKVEYVHDVIGQIMNNIRVFAAQKKLELDGDGLALHAVKIKHHHWKLKFMLKWTLNLPSYSLFDLPDLFPFAFLVAEMTHTKEKNSIKNLIFCMVKTKYCHRPSIRQHTASISNTFFR